MIARHFLKCPGCDTIFVARIGIDTADNTQFYLFCPVCKLPITGQMNGDKLENYNIKFECDTMQEKDLPEEPHVITINPFVPSCYDADSLDIFGSFPTNTLFLLLGESKILNFLEDHGLGRKTKQELWPSTRMLFEYFLESNWPMFEKTAINRLGKVLEVKSIDESIRQRTVIAYYAVSLAATNIIGDLLINTDYMFARFDRKYFAAVRKTEYITFLREKSDEIKELEKRMFNIINQFISKYEVWSMGRLSKYVGDEKALALDSLTLFRNEFMLVRDLYQQGFETSCRFLWILMATQNSVKRNDPNDFGDVHPSAIPERMHSSSIAQFNRLSNAHKIAYVSAVPGWEVMSKLLDNQRRNAIGHAAAEHNLRDGRIYSDKDIQGITYLSFLGEVFGIFEALSTLMRIILPVRLIISPDFKIN